MDTENSTQTNASHLAEIDYLLSSAAIRERTGQLLHLARTDSLEHFTLDEQKLPILVQALIDEIHQNYPDHTIPYHSRWRHFDVGGANRLDSLDASLKDLSSLERCMAKMELTIISVLLDAGAGEVWQYSDPLTKRKYSRSEGLAVASLYGFGSMVFGPKPFQVSSDALKIINIEQLSELFQVTPSNPLQGLPGRVSLMNALGELVQKLPALNNTTSLRLGNFMGLILEQTSENTIEANVLLSIVLKTFGNIWPGRLTIDGTSLGDVWKHPLVKGMGCTNNLVPFHKLSQWLTYSLLEPLEEFGITVKNIDELTGLAEYRNGGLFIDSHIIALRDSSKAQLSHTPDSELIVEWRALTISLLDILADNVRKALNTSPVQVPLAKVLQGGTWSLGRKYAKRLRNDGGPPIRILSDGTVF
jgi:hypothetical protein